MAARKFQPGQFYRLQNFEIARAGHRRGRASRWRGSRSRARGSTRSKGLLGTIVLEMGGSSRLCAALKPGEPIVLMGPTGTPTEIAENETVLLCGGGLGNAVLFSIARAFKGLGTQGALLRGLQARRGPLQAGRHRALHRPGHLVHRHGRRRSRRAGRRTRTSAGTSSRRWSRTARGSSGEQQGPAPRGEPHHRDRQRPDDGAVQEARQTRARAAARPAAPRASAASTRRCSA